MKKILGFVLCFVLLFSFPALSSPASGAEETSFTFGVSNPDDIKYTTAPPPLLNKQGINSFYFLYSKKYNVGADIASKDMLECEYGVNKNSYAQRTMVPKLADVEAYIQAFTTNHPGENVQFWWKIDKFGYTCPAGDMTSIIAFKAPADGEYTIEAEFFGGARPDQGYITDIADGVTAAIRKGDSALWSYNTEKNLTDATNPHKNRFENIALKKDDAVYFLSDPNTGFEYDLSHWYVKVIQTKVISSSGSPSATPKPEGGSQTDNSPQPSPEATAAPESSPEATAAPEPSPSSTPESTPEPATAPAETSASAVPSAPPESSNQALPASADSNSGQGGIPWLIVALAFVVVAGAAAFYIIFTHARKTWTRP